MKLYLGFQLLLKIIGAVHALPPAHVLERGWHAAAVSACVALVMWST